MNYPPVNKVAQVSDHRILITVRVLYGDSSTLCVDRDTDWATSRQAGLTQHPQGGNFIPYTHSVTTHLSADGRITYCYHTPHKYAGERPSSARHGHLTVEFKLHNYGVAL